MNNSIAPNDGGNILMISAEPLPLRSSKKTVGGRRRAAHTFRRLRKAILAGKAALSALG